MKCPRCQDLKMKSTIFHMGSSSTLMASYPYWDEEGEHHNHDMNWTTSSYRCSRGHEWSEKYQNPCPNPDCDWNKK